jgi:hypothetical protein
MSDSRYKGTRNYAELVFVVADKTACWGICIPSYGTAELHDVSDIMINWFSSVKPTKGLKK